MTGAARGGTYASRTTPSSRRSSGATRTGAESSYMAEVTGGTEDWTGDGPEDGYAEEEDEGMRDTSDSCGVR
ncbi:hypothetical protein GCM10010365_39260 [Streptomyces poonensis]|uniref:Uncharacterized protein n=1 Tax=Streptomyces poonensis TaxID=68255 RepID=A0A918UK23_9ACTN|nr:hypothetical protein GCM10010365_39260 [Streptomyces poonensis]GLJ91529.1 hypothetical protein GCM10017589_41360 [Streptomyces poonensis]